MCSGHAQILFIYVPSPRLARLRDAKSMQDPSQILTVDDVADTPNSRRSSTYKDGLLPASFLSYPTLVDSSTRLLRTYPDPRAPMLDC